MFYEIVEESKKPTAFQIERLRAYELTSRLNEVIFESFDMGTDLAFMLVLFGKF